MKGRSGYAVQAAKCGRQTGFTLIELLIVVAIVAILAALALPSYQDYVQRGKVPEATSCLSQWRTNMEQYFQDNRRYDQDSAGVPNPNCGADVCATKNFNGILNCTSATTYSLAVTGKAGTSMAGFIYTINEANAKTSTTPKWGNGATCWVTKKGETC